MNKFLRIISISYVLTPIILLSSCSRKPANKDISSFKFKDVYVEQVDNNGKKQFSFKTKKAKINELDKSISILISVGVALETMKQIDSQLMMRNYEGFLK